MNLPPAPQVTRATTLGELLDYVADLMNERALRHKVSGRCFVVDFGCEPGAVEIELPWTKEHYEIHRTDEELIRSIGR